MQSMEVREDPKPRLGCEVRGCDSFIAIPLCDVIGMRSRRSKAAGCLLCSGRQASLRDGGIPAAHHSYYCESALVLAVIRAPRYVETGTGLAESQVRCYTRPYVCVVVTGCG